MTVQMPRAWYVTVKQYQTQKHLVAVAHTERSAKVQSTKRLGKGWTITNVKPIVFACSWEIWSSEVKVVEGETAR